MTMRPLSAPQARPAARTARTPRPVSSGGADDEPGGEAVGQDEHHADGEVDAGGDHDERLGHGDEGEQRGLVGGGLHHVGGEAGRVVGDVDDEHHHEDADGHQRAALLGQPVAPVLHAILGREGGGAVKGMGTLGFSGWNRAGKWLESGLPLFKEIFTNGARVHAAFSGMLRALAISARSVISGPASSRMTAPSYMTRTRSQQPISSA